MSELINNQSKERQKKLKELIQRLHDGESYETVKEAFLESFSEVSTSEISAMEQALIEDGMPVSEVQRLCDVHAAVFGGSIADIHKGASLKDVPGHPLNVLSRENKRIEQLINEEILPYLEQSGNMPLLMLRVGFDRLNDLRNHYTRKEQLFFPYLEKAGITAPPQVMWGVDDEIRKDLKEVRSALEDVSVSVASIKSRIVALCQKVNDMVFKEENILIPLLEEKLNLYNFIKIDEASDAIGYFLEAPRVRFNPEHQSDTNKEEEPLGNVKFDAGSLTQEEANAMLNTLPLDLTFVDKDGHVRYFTQGKERIFERPITVLGRHVSMCHPPASVHIVEKIVESFQTGQKDSESFWIKMGNRFVHIRYFAVRNKEGEYLGTLEMTQEISEIINLKGEKRLLEDG